MNEREGSGGGASRPLRSRDEVVVHTEDATVGTRWEGVGSAHFGRKVDTERVSADFPRLREEVAYERVPAADGDSGKIETLADGSVSIPLFEEELVVTRRTILRERVIVRKENVTEWQRVEAELRREHVEIDGRDAPEESVRKTADE
jgi:uncharacterized protein (TIGR02271 family)